MDEPKRTVGRSEPPPSEVAGIPAGREGSPLHLHRIKRALNRGKWLLLAAVVLGALVGTGGSKLLVSSTYVAIATLKYEGYPQIAEVPAPAGHEIGAMLEGFRSEEVLRAVKTQLKLEGPTSILSRRFIVTHDAVAGVIRVAAQANDSKASADLANAVVDAFIAYHKERYRERLDAAARRIELRIAAARDGRSKAREAYDAFRRLHGITDLTAEQEQEIESAASLRAQRDLTESEIRALEARIEELKKEVRKNPQLIVQSSSASTEARQLAELQSQLTGLKSNLADDHPQVQSLERRIAALRLRVNSGKGDGAREQTLGLSDQRMLAETTLMTAQADLQAARERLTSFESLAGAAQARVRQFSQMEGEASELLARVRVAETLLSDLEGSRARIVDTLRDPVSGFRPLLAATVPDAPEPTRDKKIFALAVPLALFALALLFVLARELRGFRVIAPSEVSYWGRAPVLASSVWPKPFEAIYDLIEDLKDGLARFRGKLLVVPAVESATELARELVARLQDQESDTVLLGSVPPPAMAHPESRSTVRIAPPLPFRDGGAVLVGSPGTALALQASAPIVPASDSMSRLSIELWDRPLEGQTLRRAVRRAARVLVVVPAGELRPWQFSTLASRLGRTRGIGYVVVNVERELSLLEDRVGSNDEFWDVSEYEAMMSLSHDTR